MELQVLASYNQLTFDKVNPDEDIEELNMYKKHPLTTDEIKACLEDLKALSSLLFVPKLFSGKFSHRCKSELHLHHFLWCRAMS